MLRNVYLYGSLGKKYGREHRFCVSTPSEAARALTANYKGFYKDFKDGIYRVVVGDKTTGIEIDKSNTNFKVGNNDIHIIPIVAGSKSAQRNGGVIKTIVGVVLIVVGALVTIGTFGGGTAFGTYLIGTGIGLTAGGIAVLLTKPPKVISFDSLEQPDERSSFIFNGATNKSKQGAAVPLVFGRIRAGSVLISAGISTEQI